MTNSTKGCGCILAILTGVVGVFLVCWGIPLMLLAMLACWVLSA